MKNINSVMSVPLLLVMEMIIGVGNVDSIAFANPQKTQELQMHLDKVMNEQNNNNTETAKMHLKGAQAMAASMNDQGNNNNTNSYLVASNHTR